MDIDVEYLPTIHISPEYVIKQLKSVKEFDNYKKILLSNNTKKIQEAITSLNKSILSSSVLQQLQKDTVNVAMRGTEPAWQPKALCNDIRLFYSPDVLSELLKRGVHSVLLSV